MKKMKEPMYKVACLTSAKEVFLVEQMEKLSNQMAEQHYLIDSVNYSTVVENENKELLFSALIVYKKHIQ